MMRSILLLLFYCSIVMDAPQMDNALQSKVAAYNDGISILNFDVKSLPQDVKYRGAIIMGARWIEMKIDPAFEKAKPAKKTFAIQKWNQYVTEDEFKQF